ncbi:PREDICTED: uncharacterized protein LOC109482842 [Branchiostoma belcheri]|uniref:Uncharacterized protein LOC109482842 n=1 Tax=Branchiostoma belcheri TaxID=7741 RepID=A0A6P5A4P8_BRABE|nr:PREDICTED: uncharacterized protein LOC109482842 [Branchiostoma belcheri]
MTMKMRDKISLLLLMQLLVPCVDAGSWQSCREVSVAKCGVGDSRWDGHEYRYDIGAYRYKWTKYPHEVTSYNGPFNTVPLVQAFQSCQVCSNKTSPTQGGPNQNPSPQMRTNFMIVGNNVGKLGTDKAEILSQIPCGTKCRLWFVDCNLTDMEVGAFAKLPQVSTLVIWRSNVQTLKNDTFAGMKGLEYLLLLENNLTHLEDGCFHGLPRLSYLILVDNQILTLSPGAFLGVQPRWVDVSANLIATVAPGTLQAIKSVEYVRAVENKLRSIGVGMFYGLERLRVVNLEGNRISHIAAGAFHSIKKMYILNLAGNRLTFLSGGWFKSSFPSHVNVRGNAIAAMALEGRERKFMVVSLDNPPRCTCANDWLYDPEGMNPFKFKGRYARVMRVPSTASCPASPLKPNPPAPVNSNGLPCPVPLVEVRHIERSAAYKYKAEGDVYWEQLPTVAFAFPDGLHHTLDITYDTNTTTHDSLPTVNLTVKVVTDLKAKGWVKCKGLENMLGETGKQCSNYMGKSSFTLWLETDEPLSFGNTTCTASSETGSDTVVFAVSAIAHSDMTTLQATELTLLNTTPVSISTTPQSISISTTPLSSGISTTPLATSTSDDTDLTWYIVWAALGGLSAAAVGVGGCAHCIKQKLKRKAPSINGAGPSHNDNQIAACSMWPFPGGNSEESAISPYAEGRLEDHDSLNESESVISPYAEGGFNDHPDLRRAESSQSEIVPYGLAKLCPAYRAARRPRTHTHPVPSRPYSTERPRQKPNRAGAVLAAYGQNGRDKSGQSCYKHPSILPNPGATKSSAYQQNATATQRARKAPCYNSPALATDLKRTLSHTYDQHDPSEAVCNSAASPAANTYQPAASPGSEAGAQSAMYDENHPSQTATGGANRYVCPSPAAGAGGSQAGTYCQNDRREAVNNIPENPETNSYEPAAASSQIQ